MKYGVIVRATEEFLEKFLAPSVMEDPDILKNIVKTIILTNWGVSNGNHYRVICDAWKDIKDDTYLFRLKCKIKLNAHFFAIGEGYEYPQVEWLDYE